MEKLNNITIIKNLVNSESIIFIIVWIKEKVDDKPYKNLADFLSKNNKSFVIASLSWNDNLNNVFDYVLLSQHIEDIKIIYKTYWNKYKYKNILWFSFWAVSSFISGSSLEFNNIILWSLSYFYEFLDEKTSKSLPINFKMDLKSFSINNFLNPKTENIFILYWELENINIKENNLYLYNKANTKYKYKYVIKNNWHNLSKSYIKKIIWIINKICEQKPFDEK
jgi:hypothetical protein